MFPTADFYRLDWRPEFQKLTPFLRGRGGIVRIDFVSEDAAHSKFSHILKEDFGEPGNGMWLSLRLDDWSTTYTVDDQINAFAKKLAEGRIVVNFPKAMSTDGDVFSGNSASGNLTLTAKDSTFINGFDRSPYAITQRIKAICDGMRRFTELGGHFMVEVNDMAPGRQGQFWKEFWQAGLAEAGGTNLLLVYFVGPKCGERPHADAPSPDVCLKLPTAIEGDETRENDVYDDILNLFTKAGYNAEEVSLAAEGIIAGHGHSFLAVQEGLAKLIWRMKAKSTGGGV